MVVAAVAAAVRFPMQPELSPAFEVGSIEPPCGSMEPQGALRVAGLPMDACAAADTVAAATAMPRSRATVMTSAAAAACALVS